MEMVFSLLSLSLSLSVCVLSGAQREGWLNAALRPRPAVGGGGGLN